MPIRSGKRRDDGGMCSHRPCLGRARRAELGIPGYFYESAAKIAERKNLAHCRKGQYEGLAKLETAEGAPDFGPALGMNRHRRVGTAIGARDFLIAYNINLNTTSSRRANAIAFDIRESGRVKRTGGPGSPS